MLFVSLKNDIAQNLDRSGTELLLHSYTHRYLLNNKNNNISQTSDAEAEQQRF